MTSYTSSAIDDQQERHYIGNLLYDDDPFGPPSTPQFESSSSQQLSVGSVLPSAGPVGPSPNQAFWPEPPPPYSPYSPRPPQWSSVNRQAAELFNASMPSSYGQPPTFYSPVIYNRHGEWNTVNGRSLDGYLGSGVPYTSHSGFSNMVRHHVGNHYGKPATFPLRGGCFSANYAALDPSEALQMGTASHLTSESYYNADGSLLEANDLMSASAKSSAVESGIFVPLAGKSYRDAASEKRRANSSASAASALSNMSSSGEQGAPRQEEQQVSSLSFIKGSKRHASDNSQEGSKSLSRLAGKTSAGQNFVKKTNSAPVKHSSENEFQKITRKKCKGIKANKGEPVAADEDGLTSNQAVDASSRFDVLQSLGTQAAGSASRASSKTSTGSAVGQKECRNAKAAKVGRPVTSCSAKSVSAAARTKQSKSTDAESENSKESRNSSTLSATVDGLLQRTALRKGVFGLRRESGEQNTFDVPRFVCRKQRGGTRRRNNTAIDYASSFLLTVLSLLKGGARWIVDLVVDIFFLLKDVTVYGASKFYVNCIYSCQQFWYSFVNSVKSFWVSLLDLRTRVVNKVLRREATETNGWGLSENIQLPTTGDEAMHRLLRCRGQDAYAVLGLRADCSNEEVKHYYKRQAFLVHPDKNFAEGSVEAFKILSKAFDAIGTPETRNRYDLTNQNSPVHRELEELWECFHAKMEETRTTLPCDCGKRHRRMVMKDRTPQHARYCRRCDSLHYAKHNDIWAESSFFGFCWTYYACLDGIIYDVTQWAKCPENNLKNLKPDLHGVQYCMVSYASSKQRSGSPKPFKKGSVQVPETDDCDYAGEEVQFDADDDFAYPTQHFYGDLGNSPQLASCRTFDRRLFNTERPRRAGRRKKLH